MVFLGEVMVLCLLDSRSLSTLCCRTWVHLMLFSLEVMVLLRDSRISSLCQGGHYGHFKRAELPFL